MSGRFRSWLAPQFTKFVALKRAGGCSYDTQENLLRQFDAFVSDTVHVPHLRRDTVVTFLVGLDRLSPRARDNLLDVVWQALSYARRHGVRVDVLPPRPPRPPQHFRLRGPRLIHQEDIRAIIKAARSLPPVHRLRASTYATLYGLLFVTGMRISEALSLDVGDLDSSSALLTVRRGKFDKCRVLPLKTSTVDALEQYLSDPRRAASRTSSAPLFVSLRHRRLRQQTAWATFKALSVAANIGDPSPRLHDIRHSFAVHAVLRWYRTGRAFAELLPALSTYLGHVSVENTRTYLQANGILLEEANARFQTTSAKLDEVLS